MASYGVIKYDLFISYLWVLNYRTYPSGVCWIGCRWRVERQCEAIKGMAFNIRYASSPAYLSLHLPLTPSVLSLQPETTALADTLKLEPTQRSIAPEACAKCCAFVNRHMGITYVRPVRAGHSVNSLGLLDGWGRGWRLGGGGGAALGSPVTR